MKEKNIFNKTKNSEFKIWLEVKIRKKGEIKKEELKKISIFGPCEKYSQIFEKSLLGTTPIFWNGEKRLMDFSLAKNKFWLFHVTAILIGLILFPYFVFFLRYFYQHLHKLKNPNKMGLNIVFTYGAICIFLVGILLLVILLIIRFEEFRNFQKNVVIFLRDVAKIGKIYCKQY